MSPSSLPSPTPAADLEPAPSASRLRLSAAVAALAVARGMQHPADAVLGRFFRDNPKLGSQDRAFVAGLVFRCLRHLRLLETLAEPATDRAVALGALWLSGRYGSADLLALCHDDERAWLAGLPAHDLAAQPLAVRESVPDWLMERLQAQVPGAALEPLLHALNQGAPLDLRVNPLRASRDAVLATLRREGHSALPTPYSPLGIRLPGKPSLVGHALLRGGEVEVQDEGSQLIAFLVAPRRREMVVDFCAGAGGKTLALGALMRSEGRLYAFDTSARRLENLRPRLKRSGLSNVHPQLIDREGDPRVGRLAGKIHRVLLDVPCSGLGTLRRNPDLKWRQSPASVAELVQRQRSILAAAARLPQPGGRLVYATCSLLAEENEAVVDDFLRAHPGYRRLHCREVLAEHGIDIDVGEDFRVLPGTHGMDGFYAAVLQLG